MNKEKPAHSLGHGLKFCFVIAVFVLFSCCTIANIQFDFDAKAQLQDAANSPSISDAQNNSSGTFMESTTLGRTLVASILTLVLA